jgi:hypothetical protein
VLKRCVIFIFLITAYATFQAHNFIPHHHDIEFAADHHDDHEDSDDRDSPFSDQTHNAEFGRTVVNTPTIKGIDQKPVFNAGCFIDLFNKLTLIKKPSEYHPPDDDSPLHLIFLSHSVPLRAPPAC